MESIIYVGMDVHKESVTIAVLRDRNQEAEFVRSIKNEKRQIARFFQRLQDKESVILSCYEAGPTGFALYRQLDEMNITCYIAAPSLLPRKPGDRIKTDSRDALMLAKTLRNQELVPIHIPERSDEAVRDFLRMVDDMRKDLKRHKQRLLQFLLRIGIKYDSGRSFWTGAHRTWMKRLHFEQENHQWVFQEYYTAVCETEEKIERLNEKIKELSAEKRYKERVAELRCFKGIDTLTALTFVTEIGDFRRFSTAQKFMAYLGLVPSESSSGEKRRIGGITKAGNSRLRRLLIESSWHYRSYQPSKRLTQRRVGQPPEVVGYVNKAGRRLNRKYLKMIYRGIPSQKTVTAVARELAGFIWGMMVGKIELA